MAESHLRGHANTEPLAECNAKNLFRHAILPECSLVKGGAHATANQEQLNDGQ